MTTNRVLFWVDHGVANEDPKSFFETHRKVADKLESTGLGTDLSWEDDPDLDDRIVIIHRAAQPNLGAWSRDLRARTIVIGTEESHDDSWAASVVDDGFLGSIPAHFWQQFMNRMYVPPWRAIHGSSELKAKAGITEADKPRLSFLPGLAAFVTAASER